MGYLGRLPATLLAFCLLVHASPSDAASGPFRAESRDLGFTITSGDNANWCLPAVHLQMTAPDILFADARNEKFQQSAGRLRAAISTECPTARSIVLEAKSSGTVGGFFQLHRNAGWRLLEAKGPEITDVSCLKGNDSDEDCKRAVYLFGYTTRLFSEKRFAPFVLSRFLDPAPETAPVIWDSESLGGVVTQMTAEEIRPQPLITRLVLEMHNKAYQRDCADTGGTFTSKPTELVRNEVFVLETDCKGPLRLIKNFIFERRVGRIIVHMILPKRGRLERFREYAGYIADGIIKLRCDDGLPCSVGNR